MNKTIHVKSNIHNYDISIEDDFGFILTLQKITNKAVIIDRNVFELYKNELSFLSHDQIFLLDATEKNKNFDYCCLIYDWLIGFEAKRNLTLISIGGGITQDVTGFIASTLYRGINWHYVPTTLLAQTDSCIGSKTSLNYKSYKNLLGTFYPPHHIYINMAFAGTLSKYDFESGLGEVIKLQLMKEEQPKDVKTIADRINSFCVDRSLMAGYIMENLSIKLSYMQDDEFDNGRRNLLNYGHCFGHAVETASGYFIPHGVAVNIGIIFANIASCQRGYIPFEIMDEFTRNINLPYIDDHFRQYKLDPDQLIHAIQNDKKRTGQYLTMVIPDQQLKLFKINDFTEKEFFSAYDCLKKDYLLNKSITLSN